MHKILFFGPYSPPITGQCMAFRVVVDSFDMKRHKLVDINIYKSRVLSTISCVWKSVIAILLDSEIKVVYITSSRSKFGAIKDIPLLLFARVKGKKVVNHLHGADFKKFYNSSNRVFKFLLTHAYKGVSDTIVLTPSMVHEYEDFKEMRMHVIPNFYPEDFNKPIYEKNGEIVISYFSNLMESKGILDFLDAAKIVLAKTDNIRFEVTGDFMGDHLASRNQIKMKVEKFVEINPSLKIDFLGKIEPNARFDLLTRSDIFVLPTYYPTEGFPLSIIEAMRCGNAIIASNHNYLPEILSDSNGIMIEKKNVNEIGNALLELSSDLSRLKGIQDHNVEEAIDKYSQENYLHRITSLIEYVIQE